MNCTMNVEDQCVTSLKFDAKASSSSFRTHTEKFRRVI